VSPSRALRPCAVPGCPELVRAGRCEQHQREEQKRRDTKTDEARAFYNSRRWRNYRAAYLRKHPLCATCEAAGQVTPARIVDHVTPMSEGGAPWDPANHQGQCGPCHQRKRQAESERAKGRRYG
jgi:5-methylcytosine-specific restriction protein A